MKNLSEVIYWNVENDAYNGIMLRDDFCGKWLSAKREMNFDIISDIRKVIKDEIDGRIMAR